MKAPCHNSKRLWFALAILFVWITPSNQLFAQGKVALAKEVAEQLLRRFSKEVADEGVEKLTTRLQAVVLSAGDDALKVIERSGPRALRILENSGADAAVTTRLLSKYGDDALGALESPARLGLVREFGQEAGEASSNMEPSPKS